MTKKLVLFFIAVCISISGFASSDTIRVMAIGNSFSEDAVENYLYELGKADGVTFIIGNMFIGGCSLERHWDNASGDLAAYSYRKIGADGQKTVNPDARLSEIIPSERWDYISFQQASPYSGILDTYFPYLADLMVYTKARVTNPDVKYMFHMTWAYAQNSTHGAFTNYDHDQAKMYQAIVDAVVRAADTAKIDIVIPSGTAIQNARTSSLGDTMCRDGYHLNLTIGRYIAACVWYEKLTGNSVTCNSFAPEALSADEISIARQSANNAVLHPYKVTPF